MLILIIITICVWVSIALFYHILWEKSEKTTLDGILFYSPLNIILILIILGMISRDIIQRKIKIRRIEKRKLLMVEKMKNVDPYGEENWDD